MVVEIVWKNDQSLLEIGDETRIWMNILQTPSITLWRFVHK